tara:strand:- start:176 stop:1390 length:1215 start_codon:yes stop_codon:yes gene_type:complete
MNNFNEFAAESQEIFIDSQSSFGLSARGNQFDDFKINFNTQPFESGSDSILRLSLTQFNAAKQWYDVNENNNTFRMFNAASTNIDATDAMIVLEEGDYMNINCLGDALKDAIRDQLNASFKTGQVTVSYEPPQSISVADPTNAATGRAIPFNRTYKNENKLTMSFFAPGTQSFDTDIVFQTLQVPIDQTVTLTGGGVLTSTQQFNDSYWLLGGKRVESYEAVPTTQSFTVTISEAGGVANSKLTVTTVYPVAAEVHTLPHLYLRCDVADNQVSSNMIASTEQHNHQATHSTILGKIPRVMNGRQQVSYTLDSGLTRFFSNLNTRFMNDLRFAIVDHRGRLIPEAAPDQKKTGNMFCNFALKIEKVKIPYTPNVLQAPAPPDVPLLARTNAFSLAGTNQNINPFV